MTSAVEPPLHSSDRDAPSWLQVSAVLLIVAAYLTMTYHPPAWYLPLCGAGAIALLARFAWPGRWKAVLGLRISRTEGARAAVLTLVSVALAYGLMSVAVRGSEVRIVPLDELTPSPRQIVFTIGQTLNEEIVLGALLLGGLSRLFSRVRRIHLALAVAGAFALLHAAFYGLRPESDYNFGWLETGTLGALLGVGVLRNALILGSG